MAFLGAAKEKGLPRMRLYATHELVWDGVTLRLGTKHGRVLALVESHTVWPGLWRVRMPDGHFSDMVNLTRAKDAALSLALVVLNGQSREAA